MYKISISALLAAGMVTGAHAVPVQWTVASGGNGHWYEFATESANLAGARTNALNRTHAGLSGHLANLSSAAESSFVSGLASNGQFGWIGGSDAAVEGEWRWLDGPEAGVMFWTGSGSGSGGSSPTGYAGWVNQEPNDLNNNEDGARMFSNGAWADVPVLTTQRFFVEYSVPAVAAVPEPASLALFGLGLGGLLIARRRRS